MKLSQQQLHQIVEYIKSVGIEFDAADVEEDVEGVLWQYGFLDSFLDADLQVLKGELLPLGLEKEVAEIQRCLVNSQSLA